MKLFLANPLGKADAGEAKKVCILPLGPKTLDKRTFKVTPQTVKKLLAAASAQSNEIPVLYEHGKGARGGIAAGWISSLEEGADGALWARVRWTERAKAEIEAGEWGYLSPGLDADPLGKDTYEPYALFELSVTNIPVIDGQDKIAAERIEGGHEMDTKSLAKLAGLPEDATVEQIEAALQKKLAVPPTPPAPENMTDAQVTQLAERLGINKLGETILASARTHADEILKSERKAARVAQLLDRGKSDGKITAGMRKGTIDGKEVDPIQILAESNPEAFAAWLEKAPKVAPVPGTMPHFELSKDTIADGKAVTVGAFSKADLSDTNTRQLLHIAAQKMVAEKKAEDYAAATLLLTQPLSEAAQ